MVEDFHSLRELAISYAQNASGKLWTDYNLHDPGVTFLEQTCFGYTSLIYQVQQGLNDLLTDANMKLAGGEENSLHHAVKFLQPAIANLGDIEAYISNIEGVKSTHAIQNESGLLSIYILPIDDNQTGIRARVRSAFEKIRPLCVKLSSIQIGQCQSFYLKGRVDLSPGVNPSKAYAEIFTAVESYLHQEKGIKYEDTGIEYGIKKLNHISGVENITDLELVLIGERSNQQSTFYELVAPWDISKSLSIEFFVNGESVDLDLDAITPFFNQASNNIESDKILDHSFSLKPGRRPLKHNLLHVDVNLPKVYPPHWDENKLKDITAQYRSAINSYIQDLHDLLCHMPDVFYPEALLDSETHLQYIERLDYMLGLLGEEIKDPALNGVNFYRTAKERKNFSIDWRQGLLKQASSSRALRGIASHGVELSGFLRRIGLLADISIGNKEWAAEFYKWKIKLTNSFKDQEYSKEITNFVLPENPFEALVPFNHEAKVLSPEMLIQYNLWLDPNSLPLEIFSKTAHLSSFVIVKYSDGGWAVVFEYEEGKPPYLCYSFAEREDALEALQSIRATWRHIHNSCEGGVLVEDILLGGEFQPYKAWLVLTGWTGRTQYQPYRRYVEDLVQENAPSHIDISLRWLNTCQMRSFERDYSTAMDGNAMAVQQLRDLLSKSDERAGADG